MVETAKTQKTHEITKRATWEKIKRELLKLPKKWPEIIAIAINMQNNGITIVVSPVSHSYHMELFGVGRLFRYKYNMPFEEFNVYNLAEFIKEMPWKENLIHPGYKIIFERKYEP